MTMNLEIACWVPVVARLIKEFQSACISYIMDRHGLLIGKLLTWLLRHEVMTVTIIVIGQLLLIVDVLHAAVTLNVVIIKVLLFVFVIVRAFFRTLINQISLQIKILNTILKDNLLLHRQLVAIRQTLLMHLSLTIVLNYLIVIGIMNFVFFY